MKNLVWIFLACFNVVYSRQYHDVKHYTRTSESFKTNINGPDNTAALDVTKSSDLKGPDNSGLIPQPQYPDSQYQPNTYEPSSFSPSGSDEEVVDYDYQALPPSVPKYLVPIYTDSDATGTSSAPPFYQSLKSLDDTVSFLHPRVFSSGINRKEKQHTIIAVILDGLIHTMAQTPWQFYDREYNAKMPGLFKYGRATKHVAQNHLNCVYSWVRQGIGKLRAVMNNPWVKHVCRVSNVPCDTLVLAIVDASKDPELQKQARALLAIGKSTKLYLTKYTKALDRQASTNQPSDLYTFFIESKQFLKPLIRMSSEARKVLLSLSPYTCFDSPMTNVPDEE